MSELFCISKGLYKVHHRTSNSYFIVVEHYSHSGILLEAMWVSDLWGASEADEMHSELLEQADKVFDYHSCYNPEKGRVTLLKNIILRQQP